jgi:hypothetical protein
MLDNLRVGRIWGYFLLLIDNAKNQANGINTPLLQQ